MTEHWLASLVMHTYSKLELVLFGKSSEHFVKYIGSEKNEFSWLIMRYGGTYGQDLEASQEKEERLFLLKNKQVRKLS